MMNNLVCILCGAGDVIITEQIDTRLLTDLYRQRAGVDVKRFFSAATLSICTCNNCGLVFYWPRSAGDGKFYDELQHYKGYYLEEKAEFTEAAKFITAGDTVLEIGCGEGLLTNFITYKSYTGLELSDNAIAKAREKGLTVLNERIEQHAAEHEAGYDIVCYFQVLEHVENPGGFIRDSLKCLKAGGRLIMAVPSDDSFIHEVVNFYLNMPPHHVSRWTDNTLQKIAGLFPLSLEYIFHEPIQDIHKKFYLKTKIHRKISRLLGKKYRTFDNSFINSITDGISVVLSHVLAPVTLNKKNVIGQSVMVVYKKEEVAG